MDAFRIELNHILTASAMGRNNAKLNDVKHTFFISYAIGVKE